MVLIGDHNQLPPVVKNMAIQKYSHFDQSLFTRFVRLGVPSTVLDAQGKKFVSLRIARICHLITKIIFTEFAPFFPSHSPSPHLLYSSRHFRLPSHSHSPHLLLLTFSSLSPQVTHISVRKNQTIDRSTLQLALSQIGKSPTRE